MKQRNSIDVHALCWRAGRFGRILGIARYNQNLNHLIYKTKKKERSTGDPAMHSRLITEMMIKKCTMKMIE